MNGNGRLVVLLLVAGLVQTILGLPVVTQKPKAAEKEEKHDDSNVERMENIIEYNKYLQEVVSVLESDPVFADKLQKAAESDIRSGVIAQELEYVGHHVRSRLDELKRVELQRLKELATKQFELTNEIDRDHLKISEHVDHSNPHTFEIDDLKKLILKTSQDLMENDRRRREEFKQYELQKEFEKQEKLRNLDEEHRKTYEEDLKRQQAKHDNHEKIHHPGNKAQLEEVWEKQDHMDGQDFDPKTFFMLHDLDGNNMWDENEVKVLFINELNKMYQAGAPEDDMKERAEEMERMREHVFKEADTNKDGLISFEEFIEQTKRDEFQKDPGWDTVDHEPQFTHEEYVEFERRRQEEIQRLIAEGKLPPHPNMPQGYHPGDNGQYQVHPNAIPQQQVPHYQQQQQMQQQQYHQQQQQHYQQQQQHHQGPPPPAYNNHGQQINAHPNQIYDNVHPHQNQPNPSYTGQQSTVYTGQQGAPHYQGQPSPAQQQHHQQQQQQQQQGQYVQQQQIQSNQIPQNPQYQQQQTNNNAQPTHQQAPPAPQQHVPQPAVQQQQQPAQKQPVGNGASPPQQSQQQQQQPPPAAPAAPAQPSVVQGKH
ncbi:nucleobindin-2 [Anopheles funestus]|uniref:nucleobindin-2 n=1 Tax=Anopheles funestus TaxID=62324 RepID=UPI0020C6538E|nr:nucleobindin-2 [Anopheles funestus]XP_049294989.1 nucleobindin-2 [Anopheles funestus]XP_049294990.1 nucleobindin-2 [Anopheles funestus]